MEREGEAGRGRKRDRERGGERSSERVLFIAHHHQAVTTDSVYSERSTVTSFKRVELWSAICKTIIHIQ